MVLVIVIVIMWNEEIIIDNIVCTNIPMPWPEVRVSLFFFQSSSSNGRRVSSTSSLAPKCCSISSRKAISPSYSSWPHLKETHSFLPTMVGSVGSLSFANDDGSFKTRTWRGEDPNEPNELWALKSVWLTQLSKVNIVWYSVCQYLETRYSYPIIYIICIYIWYKSSNSV